MSEERKFLIWLREVNKRMGEARRKARQEKKRQRRSWNEIYREYIEEIGDDYCGYF